MDLKDVVSNVYAKAAEAHAAFHAGHHDVAENYLMEQMLETCAYFDGKITLPEKVTESATNEKQADEKPATPAEAPGARARPAVVDPSLETKDLPAVSESETPTR